MRKQELDIEFSALQFSQGASADAETTVTLPDGSQWVYRNCSNPKEIEKEALYWKWVNQFFPQLILDRRTVYRMEGNDKVPVGSCWKKYLAGEKKLLRRSFALSEFAPQDIETLRSIITRSFALSEFESEDIEILRSIITTDITGLPKELKEIFKQGQWDSNYKSIEFTTQQVDELKALLDKKNQKNLSAKLLTTENITSLLPKELKEIFKQDQWDSNYKSIEFTTQQVDELKAFLDKKKQINLSAKLLLRTDVKRLIDFDVPLAFAVLFFLNQSYLCVNSYSIDGVDNYKIDRFQFAEESDEIIEKDASTHNMLIRHVDRNDVELLNFIRRERGYSTSNAQNKEFESEYLLEVLYIALMPNAGWAPVFLEKQAKLRQYLVKYSAFQVIYTLSSQELLTRIYLICRQFTPGNSEDFFEYRNTIIKNNCLILVDIFVEQIKAEQIKAEQIKKADESFILRLEGSGGDLAPNDMDERAFNCEIIKSSIEKIYLNTLIQLSSESSLGHFVRCLSILTVLKNCFSLCSLYPHNMMTLAIAFQVVSEMAVNTQQLGPIARQNDEPLIIDLNKFSQTAFAQRCIDWLRRTETIGLKDVLINKNLLIYIYERAVAQFKGAQPGLPNAMEPLFQTIIHENNSDQLCEQLFKLMQIAPRDFWNLFLHQLAVVVFAEDVIVTLSENAVSPENRYDPQFIKRDIEQLLSVAKVSPEAMVQLDTHFRESLQAQIKENRDSQTSGFRTSGSGHALFSSAAAMSSQSGLLVPDQPAVQPSMLAYAVSFLTPWRLFK